MLGSEQIGEQVKRFSRNKFAANFMTGKTSALEQQHACAAAGTSDGRGSSSRAGADYDEVVHALLFPGDRAHAKKRMTLNGHRGGRSLSQHLLHLSNRVGTAHRRWRIMVSEPAAIKWQA